MATLTIATYNILATPAIRNDDPRTRTGAVALRCYQAPADGRTQIQSPVRPAIDVYAQPWPERETAVLEQVRTLARTHHVVCLQEVKPEWAATLATSLPSAHHRIFYSYTPGNNHGTALIYDTRRCSEVIQKSHQYKHRKMSEIQFKDAATNKTVRVISAHMLGYDDRRSEMTWLSKIEKSPKTEVTLFKKILVLLKSIFPWLFGPVTAPDLVIVGADFNCELQRRGTAADLYADLTGARYVDVPETASAGLFVSGQADANGLLGRIPKRRELGVCAFRVSGPVLGINPHTPDPCDPVASLSDHAFVSVAVQ